MDLMTRRRALMAQVESEPETWDLVLTAQEDGTIPSINLRSNPETSDWWGLKRGESVTIAYDMTGYDGGENRVFVECDNQYLLKGQIKQSQLTEQIGEITLANTYPGGNTPTFLISRAWSNSTEPYRFKGRYIKVRINHVS